MRYPANLTRKYTTGRRTLGEAGKVGMMQATIAAAVTLVLGFLAGFWLRSASARAEKTLLEERTKELAGELNGLRLDLKALDEAKNSAEKAVATLEIKLASEQKAFAEKLELQESYKRAFSSQLEVLAGEILDKKTKSFAEGSQKELGSLLTPLREQIEGFRKKVEEAQSDSKTGVAELRGLIGNLGNLNQKLADEAKHLSTALRGSSKAQGDWGEYILRNLLEKAGLREGEQYSFQQRFSQQESEADGKRTTAITDVIVSLPGGRHLVIDSKVSLNAYTESVNAENEEARKAALAEHLRSVRRHIDGLARAGYHDLPGIESPDFVILFIPIEPAFLTALQSDANLLAGAYEKGIMLSGPTTLLYVIRIVESLWRQEQQEKNVQKVMERGEKLYDKFVGFVDDLEAVGSKIGDADKSYKEAFSKLASGRENLVRQVEMLRELGLKPRKRLKPKLLEAAGVDDTLLFLAAESESETTANPEADD